MGGKISGRLAVGLLRFLLVVIFVPAVCLGQQSHRPESASTPWTFEAVREQLLKYPKDIFLQYVGMKLAQRQGLDVSAVPGIGEPTQREIAAQRREGVDLFSLFSGALAVQESLQLDAMRTRGTGQARSPDTVPVSSLTGPTVESHPWKQMLGDRQPEYSPLADMVPADQYYIRFRSVTRMLDLLDGSGLYARHLWTQTGEQGFLRDTESRLRTQLAVETNPLARPFYDLVVKELVVTGSDPFVSEGSDVTLIFRFEQDLVFRTQMDAYLKAALDAPGAQRTEGRSGDVDFVHVGTPDRQVHVFSAYPQPGLHVRSNSRVGLERVLTLIGQRSGSEVVSLGSTDEFRYIRTLMPFGALEEDGLIYLSDPFIRRLVGPELKLTELRRLLCLNHLGMIGHAAALFEAENGRRAASLEELRKADCLPNGFEVEPLTCSCGGHYSLAADGIRGVCSHHGHADCPVPCCEIPVEKVTDSESAQYKQFVADYSTYWRTFFDPIAIRIRATPEQYRLETIVLPLINNSIYQSLAATLGGESKPLNGTVAQDAILSLAFAIDKERLLQSTGWSPPTDTAEAESAAGQSDAAMETYRNASLTNLKQIGLAMHNYHDVHNEFPRAVPGQGGKPGLSWRVHLLPYMEEQALYDQFRLDEPWDSPNNKPLIDRMPACFRTPGAKLKPGTTTYVTVRGPKTVFPAERSVRLSEIPDGSSLTGMVIDAAPESAVIWTKPDDISLDPVTLRKALRDRFNGSGLVLMCDGSVHSVTSDPARLTNERLHHLFVRDDGNDSSFYEITDYRSEPRQDPFGLREIMGGRITEGHIYQVLVHGLGNTIGLHVCDADPMLDIQLTEVLAEMFGTRGFGPAAFGAESLWIGMAVASITTPVYIDLEVRNPTVVDLFLARLDEGAAIEARQFSEQGWFRLEKDFYKVPVGDALVRSFVLSIGPVHLRYFYTRIGDRLVIASRLATIEQLFRQQDGAPVVAGSPKKSHAQVTIHRSQWNQIVRSMRLSWDESSRQSCLDNIGPMTSASVVAAGTLPDEQLTPEIIAARAASVYGGLHLCPCGGRYQRNAEGHLVCSIHGDADHPMQPNPDDPQSTSLKVLNSFQEIRVMLSFLEDGLHAILEVDRGDRAP